MRHFARICLVLWLLLAAPGLNAETAAPKTFAGSYLWEQAKVDGPLQAEFKPTGELSWDVSFHFTFNGSPITYNGTAQGHLDNGALEGRVETGGRQRIFIFRGEFKDGKFDGTHADVTKGNEERTGTLTLGAGPG